jgi:hypothetical protein
MKSVHELSAEEFIELRERYIIEFDLDEDRISDEEVRQYYADTSFVEEDFWCNITDDEEPLFMCNCCHDHFPREEMDFNVDDDQDLCKTCNYQSYNEAPYGQD